MRIVIDMQGAQTASRFRGIGRYTLSFTKSLVRNCGEHEVILALSGLFPETIESIRSAFSTLLPSENIKIWKAPGPVDGCNNHYYGVAEIIREAFLAGLYPDLVIVTSLFEGYGDNAVTSIGEAGFVIPTAVILYDLIPYLNFDKYLKPNPAYCDFYLKKIEYLQRASILFSISDFSKTEVIESLGVSARNVISISTALDDIFRPKIISDQDRQIIFTKFNIVKKFILYAGGADERKNLPRLIEAYAKLPLDLRNRYHLVFAGRMPSESVVELKCVAQSMGLQTDDLIFTGYIEDEILVDIYNLCSVYVFPSWHEGFGLPALEAMSCGVPVIAANTSSLPEVVGLPEALFDPFDIDSIKGKLSEVLQDAVFSEQLAAHGIIQAKNFSWDMTAKRAIRGLESMHGRNCIKKIPKDKIYDTLITKLSGFLSDFEDHDLLVIADCLNFNEIQNLYPSENF
jgi:glycosyltransferase involved in cell wall biosynthesis